MDFTPSHDSFDGRDPNERPGRLVLNLEPRSSIYVELPGHRGQVRFWYLGIRRTPIVIQAPLDFRIYRDKHFTTWQLCAIERSERSRLPMVVPVKQDLIFSLSDPSDAELILRFGGSEGWRRLNVSVVPSVDNNQIRPPAPDIIVCVEQRLRAS